MSAECNECGFDIVYPPGTWPVGVCPNCTANDEIDRLRENVSFIAGGLEGLVATYHSSAEHKNDWKACGRAPCAPVRFYAEKLREVLL